MGWELISKPTTHKVTKKLAKEFAEMDAAPRDRALSERRLAVYERLFKEGNFRPCTWAKALCDETNGIYRVNGKHTSTLLSTIDPLPEFYVTIEEYTCDTLEDVAKLYATFDSKMMSRTTRDINASFAGTVKSLEEIPYWFLNPAVFGLAYYKWGQDAYNHQPAERAELILEHEDFLVWLWKLFNTIEDGMKTNNWKPLNRGPVISAIFATYIKAKARAEEFWKAVRDETGTSPSTPDRKLAKYLLATGSSKVGPRGRKLAQAGNREFYVKCLHAWNAWRKGEATDLRYFADARIPTVV